jgi:hypothetical protein
VRWKQKPHPVAPCLGAKRVVSRLLILPRLLGGEWRWLEMADIEQETVSRIFSDPEGIAKWEGLAWVDSRWAS